MQRTPISQGPRAVLIAYSGILYAAGVIVGAALHTGIYLPVKLGVGILLTLTLSGSLLVKTSSVSLLTRLIIVLYALPFSATIGYWFDDDFTWWSTPRSQELMSDPKTLSVMLMVGIVGLCGVLLGMAAAAMFVRPTDSVAKAPRLGPWGFLAFLGLAVLLSWMNAPTTTIFRAAYATEGTQGAAVAVNFMSAYIISYILIALLFIDAERSISGKVWKWTLLLFATLYIVLYLQLLRGDRESIGLVAALMALYITSGRGRALVQRVRRRVSRERSRILKLLVPAIAIVVVFQIIGFVRSSEGRIDPGYFQPGTRARAVLVDNTWTSVLLTNLGMADEYQRGMDYLWGRTYVDYLLSLPPGIVSRALGYERPIESWHGPAWWYMGLSAGGIHMVIVPFKNFGALGAFLVMAIAGFLIGGIDSRNNGRLVWRLLYASLIIISFFWAWYGDMYTVRAVMVAVAAAILYQSWLIISRGLTARPQRWEIWTSRQIGASGKQSPILKPNTSSQDPALHAKWNYTVNPAGQPKL